MSNPSDFNVHDHVVHPWLLEPEVTGWFAKFNDRLAVRLTRVVGTMWCAYAFLALSLISLPGALRTGDPVVIVAWIAQTCFQLVLLPVIMVGQNVLQTAADAKTMADHQTLTYLAEIQDKQLEILKRLDAK